MLCYLRVFLAHEVMERKRGVHEWKASTWDPVIEAKT